MKLNIKIGLLSLCLYISAFTYLYSQSPMGIPPMKLDKHTALDVSNIAVTYDMTFMSDSTKGNITDTQRYVLQIGNTISKFFNAYYSNRQKNETVGNSAPFIDGKGFAGTEVFKNNMDKTMTVTTILFGSNEVYKYTEKTPTICWKIGTNKKEIHGYLCQDAEGTFLGRKYTVWFTSEIPLSNGPWKLGGLPGLILQASDTRGHYVFECIGIKKTTPKEPILEYNVKYKSVTRVNLNRLIARLHLNFDQYMEAQGKIMTKNYQKNLSFPYNPIELE